MVNIDWSKLSFSYTQTRALVFSRCIDGAWEKPVVTEDFNIPLSSFAGIFHYAPSCFEGLKAFRGVDNKIRLFRPERNARRMKDSAIYLDIESFQLLASFGPQTVHRGFQHPLTGY